MADCNREHTTYRLKKLDDKVEELDKWSNEIKIKIEKIDEANKSAHKRLNEIGEQTLAIYKLSVAVENMAEQFKEFAGNFKDHEDRLDNLEKNPGQEAYEREKQVKNYIFMAIVGAIVGAIFMKLGVKLWLEKSFLNY